MLDTIESVNQTMYQIIRNGVHVALMLNVATLVPQWQNNVSTRCLDRQAPVSWKDSYAMACFPCEQNINKEHSWSNEFKIR